MDITLNTSISGRSEVSYMHRKTEVVPGVPGSGCGDVLFPLCRSACQSNLYFFFDYKLTVKDAVFWVQELCRTVYQIPCSGCLEEHDSVDSATHIPARSFRRVPGAGTES